MRETPKTPQNDEPKLKLHFPIKTSVSTLNDSHCSDHQEDAGFHDAAGDKLSPAKGLAAWVSSLAQRSIGTRQFSVVRPYD